MSLWDLQQVVVDGSPRARLRDVTLAIPPGVTAVLGESGAGKTTLLNLLVGFEKPSRGAIAAGVELGDATQGLSVYWSPADGGLWPHLSVCEHLAAVVPASGDDQTIDATVDALLRAFDLHDIADAQPARLSMGERSRLSVARALASGARALVMDEPLAHVDAARLPRFWAAIRDHLSRGSASLVFATHDPGTVLAEASQVICLKEGRVIYVGDVATLYRNPPTVEAARCLGEVNWLDGDEAERWLGDQRVMNDVRPTLPRPLPKREGSTENPPSSPIPHSALRTPHSFCLRPQHLEVRIDSGSALAVQSCRFRGVFSDVTLLHTPTNTTRTFVHRTPAAPLKPGDRVSLRILLSLLLACFLSCALPGCGGRSDPVLPVKSFRYRTMPPDEDTLPTPRAVGLGKEGEIIILDKAGRVLICDDAGNVKRQWRMPEYSAGKPEGACLMKDGRIAIADTHYSRVVIFDQQGNVSHMFGSLGREAGQFIYPVKVVQDDKGFLYVVEYGGNDRVQKFTPEGTFVLQFGSFSQEPGGLSRPGGMAWHEGRIYIADADNHRVQAFHDDGRLIGVLTNRGEPLKLDFPYDLCVGPDGLLYVIEYGAGRLTVITREGELVGRYGSAGRGEGQFSTPWGLRVDAQKRVWIADTGNRRVVELQL